MTNHIALYGKSGVGKTTLSANISASLVEAGFSVVLVGCDCEGDSTSMLHGGISKASVLGTVKSSSFVSSDQVLFSGYKGIKTVELVGTATQLSRLPEDLSDALKELERVQLFAQFTADFVIYDIVGDNSCSTLKVIMDHVDLVRLFVVTTADFKSLQTVNEVFSVLAQLNSDKKTPVPMGGLILNNISSSFEEAFINDFAYHTNARSIGKVPRSLVVRQAELYGQTVIESKPLSSQSYYYRRLANQIVDAVETIYSGNLPQPMSAERLRAWSLEWADRIYALENGLVADGAAI